jgi:hypothetical protein
VAWDLPVVELTRLRKPDRLSFWGTVFDRVWWSSGGIDRGRRGGSISRMLFMSNGLALPQPPILPPPLASLSSEGHVVGPRPRMRVPPITAPRKRCDE